MADAQKRYPLYLANTASSDGNALPVYDKYTQKTFADVTLASDAVIEKAIVAAAAAVEPMRAMPTYQRRAVLQHCIDRIVEKQNELAEVVCIESGKPIRDAKTEVARLIGTFQTAFEEAARIYGEVMPMDLSEQTQNYTGMWKRVPIGACLFITPFNFPLNLVAHKIAPALAVGCPFILKPASTTPISALLLGEILAKCDLPRGAFSVLPCASHSAERLVTDNRLNFLSFTGSPKVGWDLKQKAGRKRVTLELGGNAAVIVDNDSDLDFVVQRLLVGAFYQSGQSCISVQRILIHGEIYEELRDRLVADVQELKTGDPKDPETWIGPLISERDAIRLEEWVASAKTKGARVLCGGTRDGALFQPTLLENVPATEKIYCEEAFGPIATLEAFSDFDQALRRVNDSEYGLQAGVFTKNVDRVHQAWNQLEVGGVIVGDVPSWRADHMPYGGVKQSGLGREGVRFAMEEMTEIRLLVMRLAAT